MRGKTDTTSVIMTEDAPSSDATNPTTPVPEPNSNTRLYFNVSFELELVLVLLLEWVLLLLSVLLYLFSKYLHNTIAAGHTCPPVPIPFSSGLMICFIDIVLLLISNSHISLF